MKKGILLSFSTCALLLFLAGSLSMPTYAQDPTQDPNQPQPTQDPNQPQPTPTPIINIPGRTNPTPTPATPQVPGRTGGGSNPFPTHISIANCDACGYCRGQGDRPPVIPDNWENCQRCLYQALGENVDPISNQTVQGTVEGIPTPDLYHIYTDFGCISTRPGEFAAQISSFFFSIVGGIAFLFFIYGAGIIATSRSDPGRLNHGKRVIYGSIVGLLFALFSVFFIRFVAAGVGLPGVVGG